MSDTDQSIRDSSATADFPAAFFALTFLLSVPFYVLNALAHWRILGEPTLGPIYIASFTVTPIASAAILTFRRQGSRGVRELLKRIVDFGRITDRRWYLLILLLGPLLVLLSLGGMVSSGAAVPPALSPVIALPVVFLLFFLMAAGEEVGWMGYAFEPMQARDGALGASLRLGAIWALWHVPLLVFLMPDAIVLGAQVLTIIGNRVLVAWIFNNTGKSVFAAILFHAADNTALVTLPDVNASEPWGAIILCGLTLVAALITTSFWGDRTLA